MCLCGEHIAGTGRNKKGPSPRVYTEGERIADLPGERKKAKNSYTRGRCNRTIPKTLKRNFRWERRHRPPGVAPKFGRGESRGVRVPHKDR